MEATQIAEARPRTSFAGRIPWLWYDLTSRIPVPLWVLSILVGVSAYLGLAFAGWLAGDVERLLRDYRFALASGITAFAALGMGLAPSSLKRLQEKLSAWIVPVGDGSADFQQATSRALMRFFWPAFLLILIGQSPSVINPGGDPWTRDFPDPRAFSPILAPLYVVFAYFLGGAISITFGGLIAIAYRLKRCVTFRPGIVLAGKAAFAPLRNLILTMWATSSGPLLVFFILATLVRESVVTDYALASVVLTLILVTTMIPHLFINSLLAREKAKELREIQSEITATANTPETADSTEITRRMFRFQVLTHQLQQAQAFTPTLMDIRFFIQVGTSITGIVLANVLLRNLLG
ncbi:MAG: hypothetical protein FJ319_02325 [SAR202 cluster bacterium]|nr:hypothetical protein [SAR202 cluster bacterium]